MTQRDRHNGTGYGPGFGGTSHWHQCQGKKRNGEQCQGAATQSSSHRYCPRHTPPLPVTVEVTVERQPEPLPTPLPPHQERVWPGMTEAQKAEVARMLDRRPNVSPRPAETRTERPARGFGGLSGVAQCDRCKGMRLVNRPCECSRKVSNTEYF